MSASQRLIDSGLFNGLDPQTNGSVCYQLIGRYGASIYVLRNDWECHITVSALENARFPNNPGLYEFVRNHEHGMVRGAGNPAHAFRLAGEHIDQVIEIVRAGM